MDIRPRVAVFVSGSGTNLQALLDASLNDDFPGQIALVISNRRNAYGLERARQFGVEALWVPHRGKSRENFEDDLIDALKSRHITWVFLAGFMRLLTDRFLSEFPQKVINIHPSLLPAFPGLDAQRQAFDYGAKVAGATVHFVDSGTDTGAIIIQGAVPVKPSDGLKELKDRILKMEHQIYPIAMEWAIRGELEINGRVVTHIRNLPQLICSDS